MDFLISVDKLLPLSNVHPRLLIFIFQFRGKIKTAKLFYFEVNRGPANLIGLKKCADQSK